MKPLQAPLWLGLWALSIIFGAVLVWIGVPAAMLLGPMVAAIIITARGGALEIPSSAYLMAQGVLGCMIAKMLPASLAAEIGSRWPLFAGGVLSVIAVSSTLGWLMTYLRVFPGSTALWGLSPGAAPAMIVMADDYGADAQLVAFMQYLRLVVVTTVASLVMRVFGISPHHAAATVSWFAPVAWLPFIETLALAILGPVASRWLRVPAGAVLVPLAGGVLLIHYAGMSMELPPWLLVFAYATVGWRIGLRFTRPLLLHAAKMLPKILGCTLVLVAACAGLAVVLAVSAHIDPLTAYLAMSPGGADSVAIIAASSSVDVPFVMAMQIARFLVLLALGPIVAGFIAQRSSR